MSPSDDNLPSYRLDPQVGFLLRRANQRHLALFARGIPDLTSTQFAALAKLCELGQATQNALGRATAMDAATIKGVIDRLRKRDLVDAAPDPEDQRRRTLTPTAEGRALYARLVPAAHEITAATLEPLDEDERATFLRLLEKLT
ncbi:MarR family winged helix-turn-helix transcriptional regulator [Pseudodonghicola flavimaris]|uniref:MarR family transcriptional regulator n=1 Tax=Pseudodonghicola flavimaris TaxID=3050036 RepID=A0ABT7F2K2_9RHOB|nr:MarR family transcriptional regulator [Pseudodonghicola flavimaris]MDK3018725.1 MarR family transcriptional regulator [Pseudodonghicola flavimaris]